MICILLSTYNGHRFLAEQVESIRRQSYSKWRLLIRDDGSSDGTLELLHNIVAEDPRIQFLGKQENLGAAASYLQLMSEARLSDYYAFCDQDDVWDEDKLERGVNSLADFGNRPAMYCARLRLVDEKLNPLGLSRPPTVGPSYANALLQNIATGCTLMLNRAAFQLIKSKLPASNRVVMHDWWCYLVVAAFGMVVYDSHPTISYRQHEANTVGEFQGLSYWLNRFQRHRKSCQNNPLPHQLAEFQRLWGETLKLEKREQLLALLKMMKEERFLHRLVLLKQAPVQRQSVLDNFLCRLMLLFRRYR